MENAFSLDKWDTGKRNALNKSESRNDLSANIRNTKSKFDVQCHECGNQDHKRNNPWKLKKNAHKRSKNWKGCCKNKNEVKVGVELVLMYVMIHLEFDVILLR